MSSLQYYYLKPATLDTPGFCYGVGDEPARGQRIVEVQRLASGRWAEVNEPSKWLPPSALTHRKVTEQEAPSGVGTYVGSCVCVAHRGDGGSERWTYGVVTGFRWSETPAQCVLHVTRAADN
jgi:hypothetical protein